MELLGRATLFLFLFYLFRLSTGCLHLSRSSAILSISPMFTPVLSEISLITTSIFISVFLFSFCHPLLFSTPSLSTSPHSFSVCVQPIAVFSSLPSGISSFLIPPSSFRHLVSIYISSEPSCSLLPVDYPHPSVSASLPNPCINTQQAGTTQASSTFSFSCFFNNILVLAYLTVVVPHISQSAYRGAPMHTEYRAVCQPGPDGSRGGSGTVAERRPSILT